jgi:hypothetical protein
MAYLTDFQLSLAVDDILRGQGGNPQILRSRRPLLIEAAERARLDGLSLIHPIALTHEVVVHAHRHDKILLEGGGTLTGPLTTRWLAGAQRVVFVVCTIGSDLEKAIDHFITEDPLYALALDGLGNAAVENLAQQVCALIDAQVLAEQLHASSPLSPGNPEWSVEVGQPQIFSQIDPSRAGIQLTSAGMMIPKKSISFIVGIGDDMSQDNLCEVCNMKETCRYRHA